jgi:hypothetical protein
MSIHTTNLSDLMNLPSTSSAEYYDQNNHMNGGGHGKEQQRFEERKKSQNIYKFIIEDWASTEVATCQRA